MTGACTILHSSRHSRVSNPYRRFWWLVALCIAAAAIVLLLMPAEKTLGQVIKIVYLHGALSRAGMIGLLAAGATAAVFLVTGQPRASAWARGLLLSGWGFWTAHFIVSMPATRLTWGPWIAWGEPRVTMTLQVIAAGLVVIVVTYLVGNERFSAAAALLLAAALAVMAVNTGVLRHPLDPIGASPSTSLRLIYLLLLIPVVGGMFLVAWRLSAPRPQLTAAPAERR
jgi:heme exporter protein C